MTDVLSAKYLFFGLVLWTNVAFAVLSPVERELQDALRRRGLVAGFNAATDELIGVGVCEGGSQAVEVARLRALSDLVQLLHGSNVLVMRGLARSGEKELAEESISIASDGFLIGAQEMIRIVRKTAAGQSAAVAVRWSVSLQRKAMRGFDADTDDSVLRSEIAKSTNLVDRAGSLVWQCENGQVWFVGIGVANVKEDSPRVVLQARRLARLRAQVRLIEHFRRHTSAVKQLYQRVSVDEVTPILDDFLDCVSKIRNRTKGVVGLSERSMLSRNYGVSEVCNEICRNADEKLIVSVCCLTQKSMLVDE